MIDIRGKRVVIFGNNLSGKSVLAKFICSRSHPNFVWDYHNEYDKVNDFRYLPNFKDNYDNMIAELDMVINNLVIPSAKEGRISSFIFDESSQYCLPKPSRLPQSIRELNDNYRHYNNMGLVFIARRPTQLNQDITELAHYKIFFRLAGRNDAQYEENIEKGLADRIYNLQPYHFIVLDEHGTATEYPPVGLL